MTDEEIVVAGKEIAKEYLDSLYKRLSRNSHGAKIQFIAAAEIMEVVCLALAHKQHPTKSSQGMDMIHVLFSSAHFEAAHRWLAGPNVPVVATSPGTDAIN